MSSFYTITTQANPPSPSEMKALLAQIRASFDRPLPQLKNQG